MTAASIWRLARALDRPLAVDDAEGAAFLGVSARERGQALASHQAPDFTLPDLDGRLHSLREHRGAEGPPRRLGLVVRVPPRPAGLAGDLRGAEGPRLRRDHGGARQDAPTTRARGSRPRTRRIPSLIDTRHRLADLYNMVNVPTVVWIDERGRIVRPNDVAFGSDTFRTSPA